MKEDHLVAGILMLLTTALILGAVAQADGNGITAGAAILPFANSNAGAIFLLAIVAVALLAGGFGAYHLFFKARKKKKPAPKLSTPVGVSLGSMSLISEPKDPQVESVRSYIAGRRANGESDADIRQKLRSVGWDSSTIDKAFK